jgi:hypothetical protein
VTVSVAKGPSFEVLLRATPMLPEVVATPDTIDFGPPIFRGQERVAWLELANPTALSASWTIGSPFGAPSQLRDRVAFRFEPSEGVLSPGERVAVAAFFAPSDARVFSLT